MRFSDKKFRFLASRLDSIEKLRSTEAVVGWFALSTVLNVVLNWQHKTCLIIIFSEVKSINM